MNDYKADLEVLRRDGFTEEEIKRLSQLRRDHPTLEECQTAAEYNRLALLTCPRHVGRKHFVCAVACRYREIVGPVRLRRVSPA